MSPSLYNDTNTRRTARERLASSVNLSRDQSTDEPIFCIWLVIVP